MTIPETDNCADVVAIFSVLTHPSWSESQQYPFDAVRVVKPGGLIVASFLDQALELHRAAAGGWFEQLRSRVLATGVKNVMLARDQIQQWAHDRNLDAKLIGPEAIGQSVCVLTKPQ